jgi:hypothetical protein
VLNYNNIYEVRSNLFGEVISEEDEDQPEDDVDEIPSKAFMWSEAVAEFEVDVDEEEEEANGTKVAKHFAHLKTRPPLAKRSRSESDLGRIFEGDLQTPSFAVQRMPASARAVESKSKAKKTESLENRTKLLGSVGHLLAQFRRQKTWHKFKTVHASASKLESDQQEARQDVTTFV